MGFAGGSTLSITGENSILVSKIFFNLLIAASCSTISSMLMSWNRFKKPDVSMTINGTIAGLVVVTAGCDVIEAGGAAIMGIIAGIVVVISLECIDKIFKIVDPVGHNSGIRATVQSVAQKEFSLSNVNYIVHPKLY